MPGIIPFTSGWRLHGDIPEHLRGQDAAPSLRLPGAQELSAFAELLGCGEAPAETPEDSRGIPFPLPAMLPEDMDGAAELTQEIDLRADSADLFIVTFEHLAGRGEALLDGERLARFGAGPLTLDLTSRLTPDSVHTFTLRFDDTRPAGVYGPVLLHTAKEACLNDAALACSADTQTVTLTTRIRALSAGEYRLLALPCPADGREAAENPPAARETTCSLAAGGERVISLSFSLPAGRFSPGKPYAPPAVKVLLYAGHALCDSAVLMCGYAGAAERAYLPLCAADLRLPADELTARLGETGIRCVSTAQPAGDLLARSLCLAGICLRQSEAIEGADRARLSRLPNVRYDLPLLPAEEGNPLIRSAWQLGGMTAYPRPADPELTDVELLREMACWQIDPSTDAAHAALVWLRAVRVRRTAEAARQGRWDGPLCAPGEWNQADIADALRTALAPVHVSAMPLYGAWWASARFSAQLHVFCRRDVLPAAAQDAALRMHAALEDEKGAILAEVTAPCPAHGGPAGHIEAVLPDHSCVLTLTTQLLCGDTVVESSTLPVYVGENNPLDAAFDI